MDNFTGDIDTGLASVHDTDSGLATDFSKRAYDLYNAGRYDESIAHIKQDPKFSTSAFGHVLVGNCYRQIGDMNSAVSFWEKATEISPLDFSAYMNLGNYYYSLNNLKLAILNWTIASTIIPENPTVNFNLALAYDKKGFRIKSTKYFEKFLKYESNKQSNEYVMVKQRFANLMAKVDFYARKVEEFKLQKNLEIIAALYLKMIATYSLLPSVYANIGEIFNFDKNYSRALEFFRLIYLNFPFTSKILIEVANLSFINGLQSYAYVYYKRALQHLPEGTSHYVKVTSQLSSLEHVFGDSEAMDFHLEKAQEAAEDNDYETAVDEYENYMLLSDSELPDIQKIIDKYKVFVNPEPFVIGVLYNQIPELMNKKKLNTCIEVCDRIISMAKEHSKEVVYAMKCKSDCKRIIVAREQFGV